MIWILTILISTLVWRIPVLMLCVFCVSCERGLYRHVGKWCARQPYRCMTIIALLRESFTRFPVMNWILTVVLLLDLISILALDPVVYATCVLYFTWTLPLCRGTVPHIYCCIYCDIDIKALFGKIFRWTSPDDTIVLLFNLKLSDPMSYVLYFTWTFVLYKHCAEKDNQSHKALLLHQISRDFDYCTFI